MSFGLFPRRRGGSTHSRIAAGDPKLRLTLMQMCRRPGLQLILTARRPDLYSPQTDRCRMNRDMRFLAMLCHTPRLSDFARLFHFRCPAQWMLSVLHLFIGCSSRRPIDEILVDVVVICMEHCIVRRWRLGQIFPGAQLPMLTFSHVAVLSRHAWCAVAAVGTPLTNNDGAGTIVKSTHPRMHIV